MATGSKRQGPLSGAITISPERDCTSFNLPGNRGTKINMSVNASSENVYSSVSPWVFFFALSCKNNELSDAIHKAFVYSKNLVTERQHRCLLVPSNFRLWPALPIIRTNVFDVAITSRISRSERDRVDVTRRDWPNKSGTENCVILKEIPKKVHRRESTKLDDQTRKYTNK